MDVLEFGCGTGTTALIHAPYVKQIQAIDISSKTLAIAQRKADTEHIENVTFQQITIEQLEVPENTFDVVMGHSILHLLENEDAAIAKVYRILKPGGIFVSSTVCIGETIAFFKIIGPIGHFLRLLPLIKVFTPQELEEKITHAGFAIDHQWQPGKGKSVFVVAKKPA